MKIYSNEKLIKRNSKLGQIASIVSLVVLGVGMYFSFKDTEGKYIALTFGSLIVGFLVFQFGNYYLSRWGKSPRPDELVTSALKGLDDRFSLYHYITPIYHLLVGPNCVYALLPYNQAGSLYYDLQRNRWRQRGGSAFLKLFGNEGLGRPDLEVKYAQSDLDNYAKKLGQDPSVLKDNVIIVFTNGKADLSLEDSPSLAVSGEKLKDFLRKRMKENPLPAEWVSDFQGKLPS